MQDSPGGQDIRAFGENQTTRKETMILRLCIRRLSPISRSWSPDLASSWCRECGSCFSGWTWSCFRFSPLWLCRSCQIGALRNGRWSGSERNAGSWTRELAPGRTILRFCGTALLEAFPRRQAWTLLVLWSGCFSRATPALPSTFGPAQPGLFHKCVWLSFKGFPDACRNRHVCSRSWASLSALSSYSYHRMLRSRKRSCVDSFAFGDVAAPHLFPLLHTPMPWLHGSRPSEAFSCVSKWQ